MSDIETLADKLGEMLDEYEKAARAAGACSALTVPGNPDLARANSSVASIRDSVCEAIGIALMVGDYLRSSREKKWPRKVFKRWFPS